MFSLASKLCSLYRVPVCSRACCTDQQVSCSAQALDLTVIDYICTILSSCCGLQLSKCKKGSENCISPAQLTWSEFELDLVGHMPSVFLRLLLTCKAEQSGWGGLGSSPWKKNGIKFYLNPVFFLCSLKRDAHTHTSKLAVFVWNAIKIFQILMVCASWFTCADSIFKPLHQLLRTHRRGKGVISKSGHRPTNHF